MDNLPCELLISIFELLEYDDLKGSVPLVCRRFNTIISNTYKFSVIDCKLFRDVPTAGLLPSDQRLLLHPVLGRLHLPSKPLDADIYRTTSYAYKNRDELGNAQTYFISAYISVNITFGINAGISVNYISTAKQIVQSFSFNNHSFSNTSTASENATSPPATRLFLCAPTPSGRRIVWRMHGSGVGGAVTVRDVIFGSITKIIGAAWGYTLSMRRPVTSGRELLGGDVKGHRYLFSLNMFQDVWSEEVLCIYLHVLVLRCSR